MIMYFSNHIVANTRQIYGYASGLRNYKFNWYSGPR